MDIIKQKKKLKKESCSFKLKRNRIRLGNYIYILSKEYFVFGSNSKPFPTWNSYEPCHISFVLDTQWPSLKNFSFLYQHHHPLPLHLLEPLNGKIKKKICNVEADQVVVATKCNVVAVFPKSFYSFFLFLLFVCFNE